MNRIFSKKFLLVIFSVFFFIGGSNAQGNLPYVDDKPLHFGYALGLNFMDFAVVPADINKDVSVTAVAPGFSVGAISDLRLNRYFNLRFTPTLMLSQRTLNYKNYDPAQILSVPLYLPLYIKYSSERKDNYRPYVLAGGGLWMDWGRNKERAVLLNPFDALVEAGVGCDLYFPFFKLSPVLKFAVGVSNVITPTAMRDTAPASGPGPTDAISKLTTRMITLAFNIE
ncbi:MAG TPA: outer membrane beta-barrel protein [Paludibacteraceae bacterium]|jgi:hypothetical protein|nr:outer membrane beta-barrel protein [Paludibacteraceae bacterium]HPS09886.1 outer membrane beta-barrel protein [Paludibacteraceae bacterium]